MGPWTEPKLKSTLALIPGPGWSKVERRASHDPPAPAGEERGWRREEGDGGGGGRRRREEGEGREQGGVGRKGRPSYFSLGLDFKDPPFRLP